VYKEEVNASNGWDRYNDYEQWKHFDLLDLIVGAPYISLNWNGTRLLDDPIHFSFYTGVRHILKKDVTDLAQGIDFEYKDPAYFFGIKFGKDF